MPTASELSALLRERAITSREIVEDLLARRDEVGAYIVRFDGAALEAADRLDRERARGRIRSALHGVPIAVKDLVATSEAPTTSQSRVTPLVPAGVDAPAITRLRAAGAITARHRHLKTEEIYHITAGRGLMTLGEKRFEVAVGDTVCIGPGTAHCIECIGVVALELLCACAPAYAHDDTELL